MPSVDSSTSTGYSYLSYRCVFAWRIDMTSVIAEAASVSSFMNRAKSSCLKAPPKPVPCWPASHIHRPAAARRAMASPFTSPLTFSRENAPSISKAIAPTARISSGVESERLERRSSGISALSVGRRRLGGVERCCNVGDQRLHGLGRRVEHGRGIDTEEDNQHGKRIENRLFAWREVQHALEAVLGQCSEYDAAVEPKRIGGRQDDAGGGKDGDPGVDAEDPQHGQELADEAAGARQSDIGHGKYHECGRIFRHVVDQPAISGDLAGVQAIVNDADAQKQSARHKA